MQSFLESQPPSCVVVDPPQFSEILLDRARTFKKLATCHENVQGWTITSPKFATVQTVQQLVCLELQMVVVVVGGMTLRVGREG